MNKKHNNMIEPKKIKVSEILNDFKSGLTRWEKEDIGFGNIQEKYELKFSEMKQLLNHPKIKGVRTLIPSLIIIDDTEDTDSEVLVVSEKTIRTEESEDHTEKTEEYCEEHNQKNNRKTFI